MSRSSVHSGKLLHNIRVDHIFNVVLQGVFPGGQGATIGVDFMIKTVTVNGNYYLFESDINLLLQQELK